MNKKLVLLVSILGVYLVFEFWPAPEKAHRKDRESSFDAIDVRSEANTSSLPEVSDLERALSPAEQSAEVVGEVVSESSPESAVNEVGLDPAVPLRDEQIRFFYEDVEQDSAVLEKERREKRELSSNPEKMAKYRKIEFLRYLSPDLYQKHKMKIDRGEPLSEKSIEEARKEFAERLLQQIEEEKP